MPDPDRMGPCSMDPTFMERFAGVLRAEVLQPVHHLHPHAVTGLLRLRAPEIPRVEPGLQP